MKRIIRLGTAVATLVASWAVGMSSVIAQENYPPTVSPFLIPRGNPGRGAAESAGGGGAGGALAFTGLQLTVLMAIVAALVAVGIGLYVAGRRRAARATG